MLSRGYRRIGFIANSLRRKCRDMAFIEFEGNWHFVAAYRRKTYYIFVFTQIMMTYVIAIVVFNLNIKLTYVIAQRIGCQAEVTIVSFNVNIFSVLVVYCMVLVWPISNFYMLTVQMTRDCCHVTCIVSAWQPDVRDSEVHDVMYRLLDMDPEESSPAVRRSLC